MTQLGVASLVLVLVSGCAASAYRRAVAADSVEGYEAYLASKPSNAQERAAATARYSELSFERAKAAHTLVAYKRFLEAHPDSAQAKTARALLETIRFNAAVKAGTSSALRAFLHDHPDGAHAAEAKGQLATAEFKEIGAADSTDELSQLLQAYPDDPRRDAVANRIDDRAFAQAKTARALLAYLKAYPAGAHRLDAQRQLLERKVRSGIWAGAFAEARKALKDNPLGKELTALPKEIDRAEQLARQISRSDAHVQAALPGYYLRPFDELQRALGAPDPLDRWQAAQELGEHITPRAIDPLLSAIRTARNPRVRFEAFEALRRVVRALPVEIAEYELAARLEDWAARAADSEVQLGSAILLDLAGSLSAAASDYQRAFSTEAPDPVILRRWVEIRRERKQHFSAAVAARRLALWAESAAEEPPVEGTDALLGRARQLCAAQRAAAWADAQLSHSRGATTEFPQDIEQFGRDSARVLKRLNAALADAEVALQTAAPGTRSCSDERVEERIQQGESLRQAALEGLATRRGQLVRDIWRQAMTADPSTEVRIQAQKLVAAAHE